MFIREEDYRKLIKTVEDGNEQIERLISVCENSLKREKFLMKLCIKMFDLIDENCIEFPEEVKQHINTVRLFVSEEESN